MRPRVSEALGRVSAAFAVTDPEAVARVGFVLFLVGALTSVAAIFFPDDPNARPLTTGLLACCSVAGAIGFRLSPRLPRWAPAVLLAYASGITSAAVYIDHAAWGLDALFYFWIVLFAAYFFRAPAAAAEACVVALTFGIALLVKQPTGWQQAWFVVAATTVVTAVIVGRLQRRSERLLDELRASEAEVRLRADARQAIAELGQRALAGGDLAALQQQAGELLRRLLRADLSTVLRLADDGMLEWVGGAGWTRQPIDRVDAAADGSLAGYTLRVGVPVVAPDLARETRFTAPPPLLEAGVVSSLNVVIAGTERPYGVLGCHSFTPRAFGDDDVHVAQSIANVLAAAIQRRQVEEALRASEKRLRTLLEATPLAIVGADRDGNVSFSNAATERLYGWSVDELSLSPSPFVPASARAEAAELGGRLVAGELVVGVEAQRLRKDGAAVDVELFAAPLLDECGEYDGYIGIVGDITERKAAERALRASEERYRELFENARDLLVTTSLDGTITSANRAAEQLTGLRRDELVGRRLTDLFTPESAERAQVYVQRLLVDGADASLEELELVAADGSARTIEAGARLIRGRGGEASGLQCVGRDITERLGLEAHLRQAQKMEAVGRLAGGIAHDFNNLLTAISGFSDFALGTLEPAHPVREDIVEIQRAADRAATLTGQLLAFSRRQVRRPKVLHLADVVSDLEAMLRRLIGEDVALVSVHEEDPGAVLADSGQIEQVILNLALNARDAMPRGGTVTVETANVVLDDGPHVMLAVSDTGDGIDAETLQHVFEPFFTTKDQGKGTGLGLATVYGIVEQSGGSVEVSSEPGRGTRFKIYLPRVDSAPEPVVLAPRQGMAGGSETVLVVEDEPLVRELARRALARHGYVVLEAADGSEALDVCRGHAGRIDVLLSDVVMPGLSGPELAREVAALRPETRPLFMSGYTDEALGQHGVLESSVAFIGKPFTPEGLALRVRDLLEERKAA